MNKLTKWNLYERGQQKAIAVGKKLEWFEVWKANASLRLWGRGAYYWGRRP
jgi:hypothetical protein